MNVVGLGKTSLQSIDLQKNLQSKSSDSVKSQQKSEKKQSFSQVLSDRSPAKSKRSKTDNKSNTQSRYNAHSKSNDKAASKDSSEDVSLKQKPIKKFPGDTKRSTDVPNSYSAERANTLDENKEIKNNFDSLTDRLEHLGYVESEIVDPLTRRASIQKFMAKMQDEFDVKPKDLVGAFGQLSTDELGMAPEVTVAKVVEKLGLNSFEKMQSNLYFKEMLKETESTSMAEYLKGSSRQLSLEVMSKNEAKQENLNNSIDKMQSSFFIKDSAKQVTSNTAAMNSVVDSGLPIDGFEKVQKQTFASQFIQSNLENPSAQALVPMVSKGNAGGSFDGMMAQLSMMKNSNLEASAVDSAVQTPQSNMAINSYLNQSNAFEQSDFSDELASQGSLTQGSEDLENVADENAGFSTMISNALPKEAKVNLIPVNNNLINVTAENEAENVQAIITNAQTMIKNGGGEVKVNLNPEGLGELNLKVSVEEGKVNIDVITENKAIKKLVENGLGDLKATLQAHKLDVDQIKVDVNNDLMDDFNQKQDDADQQFARKFMQDFSRQNQQFREGLGFGSANKTSSQMESKQQDIDELISSQKKSSNRALDLVA